LVGFLDSSAQGGDSELDVGASPFAKEEGLCDKGMKGFCFLRGQLGGSAGGVEVRRSWGRNGILGVDKRSIGGAKDQFIRNCKHCSAAS